jgi:DNA-directed RNA polymerase I, II, and III subunit RPABC2
MADDDDIAPIDDDYGADLDILDTQGSTAEQAADPLQVLIRRHPECKVDYRENVIPKIPLLASPPIDKDPNHRSPPFLTQYEKTKIIGLRTNQLSQGARPYIAIPEYMTDVWEIARLELEQRRLPFLVRRPMPDGTHEYWRLSDLLIL